MQNVGKTNVLSLRYLKMDRQTMDKGDYQRPRVLLTNLIQQQQNSCSKNKSFSGLTCAVDFHQTLPHNYHFHLHSVSVCCTVWAAYWSLSRWPWISLGRSPSCPPAIKTVGSVSSIPVSNRIPTPFDAPTLLQTEKEESMKYSKQCNVASKQKDHLQIKR